MKEDIVKLSAQVQEGKRIQSIRLYKKGCQYKEIAELVGLRSETTGKGVRTYIAKGVKGIVSQLRSRKTGSGSVLMLEQEKEVQRLITDKSTDQLKMVYTLWTRKAIKELIEDKKWVFACQQNRGGLYSGY